MIATSNFNFLNLYFWKEFLGKEVFMRRRTTKSRVITKLKAHSSKHSDNYCFVFTFIPLHLSIWHSRLLLLMYSAPETQAILEMPQFLLSDSECA